MEKSIEKSDEIKCGRLIRKWFEYQR